MTIFILALLILGAASVLVTAPLALFVASVAFDSEDASQSPLMHVGMLLFLLVPASAGWCVYQGWLAYKQGMMDSAWHYGAYPALLFVLGAVALAIVIRSNATVPNQTVRGSDDHDHDDHHGDGEHDSHDQKHGHSHHHKHGHSHDTK
jgi:hypothetical protein